MAGVAGVLIGLSLGALGGGGSILAVPVLVYLLGQGPAQATTGTIKASIAQLRIRCRTRRSKSVCWPCLSRRQA